MVNAFTKQNWITVTSLEIRYNKLSMNGEKLVGRVKVIRAT